MTKFLNFLKGKLAWIFMMGVYLHRLIDALNDLRYELQDVKAGEITLEEFFQQIIPTLKYHLSGEFQQRVAQYMKQEHIGLLKENK